MKRLPASSFVPKWVTAAESCEDREAAYAMMHLAEDILMSTGCIMPLFYY